MQHFSQNFEMPRELENGTEIIIKFTANFYPEFMGFDHSGNADEYGDFYAEEIVLENSELETEEIIDACKNYANDNKDVPEPTQYSFND